MLGQTVLVLCHYALSSRNIMAEIVCRRISPN